MQLETIRIDDFSPQEEYGRQTFTMDGETTLIHGPNRSGKTLTFCAISYAVLQESWGARKGRGAEVHAEFTPEGTYTASAGKHRFEIDGQEYTSENAKERVRERLGPRRFTRHFFLHSQVSKLPLERVSGPDVVARVREAVAPDVQAEIGQCRERRQSLTDNVNRLQQRREAITERLRPHVGDQIDDLQRRIDREERILELGDDGVLAEICDTLSEHAELDAELQSLYDRREEVESELSRLQHRREHLAAGGDGDDYVPVAGLDRDCPACGVTVPEAEARRRAQAGACPVCQRGTAAVREGLPEATAVIDEDAGVSDSDADDDGADERAELDAKIADCEEALDDLDDEIETLTAEQPSLSALDDRLRRRLQRHDRDVAVVVADARARIDNHEADIESLRERRRALEDEVSQITERLPKLEQRRDDADARHADLQATVRDRVVAFAQRWTETFESLSPTLGMEVGFRSDEGVLLPGSPERAYGQGDNLSDAERLLVNLSFGITLHETLDDDLVSLDTFVLDDPFVHLDDAVRQDVLSFIDDDDNRQYVFTASDPAVETAADNSLEISQGPMKTELDDFVGDGPD